MPVSQRCFISIGHNPMLIREIISKQPLSPIQQQQANLKQQQKQLKVKKAQLKVQAAQEKLNKARQG
jgi:hypothetical protein